MEKNFPVRRKWGIPEILGTLADLLAIGGVIFALWKQYQGTELKEGLWIPPAALVLLCIFLIVRVVALQKDRSRRHDLSPYFIHFANHCVRDYFGQLDRIMEKTSRDLPSIEDLRDRILNAAAASFSNSTGRRCRASLVELRISDQQELLLKTVARDEKSEVACSADPVKGASHDLHSTTSFLDLWYGDEPRCFSSNNLPKLWSKKGYKNPGLLNIDSMKGMELFRARLTPWPLKYRSTMVFPIRSVVDYSPPAKGSHNGKNLNWDFWGFLCIDCHAKNVFDKDVGLELGGAFADELYLLFRLSDRILDIILRD